LVLVVCVVAWIRRREPPPELEPTAPIEDEARAPVPA
jgi:hypothetical protein